MAQGYDSYSSRKSEKQQQIESEYRALRRQIKSYKSKWQNKLKRALTTEIPPVPKRITEGSIRRLQEVKDRLEREVEAHQNKAYLGEIVYANILNLLGDPKNLPEAEKYVHNKLESVINTSGRDRLMENLYETDPDVVADAQKILTNYEEFKHEKEVGFWYSMIKYGEVLTEEEARNIGGFSDFEPWQDYDDDEENPFDDDEQYEISDVDEEDYPDYDLDDLF